MQDAQILSQASRLDEGEKPSKHFLQLKSSQLKDRLILDSNVYDTTDDIVYLDLFTFYLFMRNLLNRILSLIFNTPNKLCAK